MLYDRSTSVPVMVIDDLPFLWTIEDLVKRKDVQIWQIYDAIVNQFEDSDLSTILPGIERYSLDFKRNESIGPGLKNGVSEKLTLRIGLGIFSYKVLQVTKKYRKGNWITTCKSQDDPLVDKVTNYLAHKS